MRRRLSHRFPACELLLLAIACACPAAVCRAQIVINEVYYDHPGRDDGWEFIELYNTDTVRVRLAGFALEFVDGTSARPTTVWSAPADLSIEPKGYLCVAGAERNPAAGLALRGALGNGPDAVKLLRDGVAADLVGYGELTRDDLFESTPAVDVEPGWSLARKPDGADSNRNGSDFVPASPSPGGVNFHAHDLALVVSVRDPLPCRGAPLSLIATLLNTGYEPLGGPVSVVAEARCGGSVVASARADRDVALGESGCDSMPLVMLVPPGARFDLRAHLSSALDGNPSNDTAAVALATSPGAVVMNEVMYRPRSGESEWIELACGGLEASNLKGWRLSDATGRLRLVSEEDLVLVPGAYLVLAEDSAAFAARYPDCRAAVRRLAGGWPSLNDTDRGDVAETIELVDSSGTLVERVMYRDLLGEERGRSIERISETACSSAGGGIWHRSAAGAGATPGAPNSIHAEEASRGGSIDVRPNPFRTREARETVISGRARSGETGFVVRVFDLQGIEVRRLYGEEGGAPQFACRWDGRADSGSLVRTGLYVCLVEFVRMGGGVCRREKRCVVVVSD